MLHVCIEEIEVFSPIASMQKAFFHIHVIGKLRQAGMGGQCLEIGPDTDGCCCRQQPVIREIIQETLLGRNKALFTGVAIPCAQEEISELF